MLTSNVRLNIDMLTLNMRINMLASTFDVYHICSIRNIAIQYDTTYHILFISY